MRHACQSGNASRSPVDSAASQHQLPETQAGDLALHDPAKDDTTLADLEITWRDQRLRLKLPLQRILYRIAMAAPSVVPPETLFEALDPVNVLEHSAAGTPRSRRKEHAAVQAALQEITLLSMNAAHTPIPFYHIKDHWGLELDPQHVTITQEAQVASTFDPDEPYEDDDIDPDDDCYTESE